MMRATSGILKTVRALYVGVHERGRNENAEVHERAPRRLTRRAHGCVMKLAAWHAALSTLRSVSCKDTQGTGHARAGHRGRRCV